ncbi:MAG: hypothetical protein OXQ31_14225 [Spirochaetaceae bacterium]|nr:hypothetical protein [Spirochaetaceae bacterium]
MAVTICTACRHGPGMPRQVAGTYTGALTIQHYFSTDAGMKMIVTQAGERVTIIGTIMSENSVLPLINALGTIDATGLFVATEGGLSERTLLAEDDPQCGQRMWVGGSLVFNGNQARLGAIMNTGICGQVTYRATLTRSP